MLKEKVITKYMVHELVRSRIENGSNPDGHDVIGFESNLEMVTDGIRLLEGTNIISTNYIEGSDFDIIFTYDGIRYNTCIMGGTIYSGFTICRGSLADKLGIDNENDIRLASLTDEALKDDEFYVITTTDLIRGKMRWKIMDASRSKDITEDVLKIVDDLEKGLELASVKHMDMNGLFDNDAYYKVTGRKLNELHFGGKAEPLAVSLTFEEVRCTLDDKYTGHVDEILAEITSHEYTDVVNINDVMKKWEAKGIVFSEEV